MTTPDHAELPAAESECSQPAPPTLHEEKSAIYYHSFLFFIFFINVHTIVMHDISTAHYPTALAKSTLHSNTTQTINYEELIFIHGQIRGYNKHGHIWQI